MAHHNVAMPNALVVLELPGTNVSRTVIAPLASVVDAETVASSLAAVRAG